ncbi:MAG: hypothetical protein J6U54_05385 [Clostridiales bacterium]|nr:hypothetical protein [Clostridiales bacterium]
MDENNNKMFLEALKEVLNFEANTIGYETKIEYFWDERIRVTVKATEEAEKAFEEECEPIAREYWENKES